MGFSIAKLGALLDFVW